MWQAPEVRSSDYRELQSRCPQDWLGRFDRAVIYLAQTDFDSIAAGTRCGFRRAMAPALRSGSEATSVPVAAGIPV